MDIQFDPEKEAINPLNHEGVTFDEAIPVLLDPYALTDEDTHSEKEQRYITLVGREIINYSYCAEFLLLI